MFNDGRANVPPPGNRERHQGRLADRLNGVGKVGYRFSSIVITKRLKLFQIR